jgi:nitroreductase
MICRDAPHLIIAHGHKDDRTAPVACAIALTCLELAAPSFELGACWAGYFNTAAMQWRPIRDALKLPEKNEAFGSMMIGYPEYFYSRMPHRNKPKIEWR